MSRKMADRGLVDPASCVHVNSVDDFIGRSLALDLMLNLVLAGWCE